MVYLIRLFVFTFFLSVLILLPFSFPRAQSQEDKIRGLNNKIVGKIWQLEEFSQGGLYSQLLQNFNLASEPAEVEAEIQQLSRQRKQQLLELVERDASQVFPLLLDQGTRSKLPASVQSDIEQPIRVSGQYLKAGIDDFDNQVFKEQSVLLVEQQEHTLHFRDLPENIAVNDQIEVQGMALENQLLIDNTQSGNLDILSQSQPLPAASVPQQAIAILFKFSSSTPDPYPQSRINSILFSNSDSVANYFTENSFEIVNITGTVSPQQGSWYVIAGDTTTCDYLNWETAAREKAVANGVNLGAYQYIVFMFPRVSACSWNGLGYYYSPRSFINGLDNTRIIAHEFGHNLGNNHAQRIDCEPTIFKPLLSGCSLVEYGDITDTMGWAIYAEFNLPNKLQSGWISADKVKTVSDPVGQYTIYANEIAPASLPSGAVQALKIVRASEPNVAYQNLYISYRRPLGVWDSKLPGDTTSGVSLHLWQGNSSKPNIPKSPFLLDTTPGSQTSNQDYYDASLTDGRSVYDEQNRIFIKQISHDSEKAVVQVFLNADSSFKYKQVMFNWGSSSPLGLDFYQDGVVNFLDM